MKYLLLFLAALALGSTSRAADSEVSGVFTGNGKPAKTAYVTALKGDEFDGKPTVLLVFTEKDPLQDDHLEMHASFGKLGSALIITIFPDNGKIIGCDVAHEAHEKKPFSSTGSIDMSDYKNENGQLSGKIATEGGEIENLQQKWEVNLTFKVKAP